MKIGVLINLTKNVEADFAKANELGIKTCQLCCWDLKLMTDETADMITKLSEKFDVEITALVWMERICNMGLQVRSEYIRSCT